MPKLMIPMIAATLISSSWVHAEVQETAPPDPILIKPARALDVSVGTQRLSGGFGPWRSLLLHGTYELDRHVLQGELSQRHEFGVNGAFFGIADAYTINPDWIGSLAIGAGDGAFFLPRFRADGTISRKLLPAKNLVASVAAGYYDAPDGHRDHTLGLSGTYYFKQPVVVEAGVRFNRSNPGSVFTHQQFVAATFGKSKQDFVVARAGWGSEGYLAIGPASSLVGFNSKEFNLSWRHWMTNRMGVLSALTHYRNPSYERSGVDIGAFFEFD